MGGHLGDGNGTRRQRQRSLGTRVDSGNGVGARAAACLGGDPGDGDFVQTGADVETAWMR